MDFRTAALLSLLVLTVQVLRINCPVSTSASLADATLLDEHFVETQVVSNGVLKAILVGSEARIPLEDPVIDLRQLEPPARGVHEGAGDQLLVVLQSVLAPAQRKNTTSFHPG